MKIVIAGGSGFIGNKLTDFLISKGYEVIILTRKQEVSTKNASSVLWLKKGAIPEKKLENVDAFINLAGVSINDGRWTLKHQRHIYHSRMVATNELVRMIKALSQKPAVFINASAIGIYPTSLENEYTEKSKDIANDFLGKTVSDWESTAKQVEKDGIRPVFMRFGVVLGKDGGALRQMVMPYKLFAGGTVGTGRQWVSWIHIEDVIRSILFAIHHDQLYGPVNVTSPTPIIMEDFGKAIGSILKRPHWLPVPSFILKVILGQKSKLVLEGQKVIPKALIDEGFEFSFPKLERALEDLLH